MILFVGCSYTWGSGLQYEDLYDKGWSIDKLSDDIHLQGDGHFNSKGCKVIADSIVKKLKQYETKTNKK